jgi:hypothetical protein
MFIAFAGVETNQIVLFIIILSEIGNSRLPSAGDKISHLEN